MLLIPYLCHYNNHSSEQRRVNWVDMVISIQGVLSSGIPTRPYARFRILLWVTNIQQDLTGKFKFLNRDLPRMFRECEEFLEFLERYQGGP